MHACYVVDLFFNSKTGRMTVIKITKWYHPKVVDVQLAITRSGDMPYVFWAHALSISIRKCTLICFSSQST
jgi:hypothetical protein